MRTGSTGNEASALLLLFFVSPQRVCKCSDEVGGGSVVGLLGGGDHVADLRGGRRARRLGLKDSRGLNG